MVIDWRVVVVNLRRAGLSSAAVGRRIGRDPSMIRRLGRREKAEPLFSVGMALLDLHEHVCYEEHKRVVSGERG